ncbi:50S ribosomal protein L25 [Bacteroidetes bacterium UKL13-3]|jgi:large subunit ribosomal protein L25|nr:50S ribosomal protein L25 [Bacteroidetes bacterium UKL13-3]HCP94430.1 50S ribosomal protein L25 [Bacteroidota bacterium]
MKSIAMFGYLRDGVGKSSTKVLRNEGKVPCVLYGGGKESVNFSMYSADFKQLVYTPNTYKVKLDIDGKIYRAMLKDIQFHPVNDSILHADFQEIDETKEIEIGVPIKLVGNSVGVRAGGKLVVKSNKLRVRALSANLPDFIEVNIDNLEIGKSIKVGEIKVENMKLMDAVNNSVVSVKTTRAAQEEAKAAAAADKKK